MTSRRFWTAVAIVCSLNAAAWLCVRHELLSRGRVKIQPVRLVQALPKTNIDRADRLSLIFDSPLARPEMLQQPLERPPFRVEPELPGTWVFSEPARLDFLPDEPLPPGRNITLTPAPDIELQTGRVVQVDHAVEFQTRPLKLDDCELLSGDRDSLSVELQFNQPVAPEALIAALHAWGCDDRGPTVSLAPALTCTPLTREPHSHPIVRITRPQPATPLVRIEIEGHLAGHEAARPLGEDVVAFVEAPGDEAESTDTTVPAAIPTRLPFTTVRAIVPEIGTSETLAVQVLFSLNFRRDQPVPQVTLTPTVEGVATRFGTHGETEFPTLVLEGTFTPGTRYTAEVAPTLVADDGTPLESPARISFDMPDRDPAIEFVQGQGILSPQGNLQLDLKTVGVGSLKLATSRVHANNLVSHLQGEYRRRTSRALSERTVSLDEPQKLKRRTLDLKPLFDRPTGIFQLEARALDQAWTADWTTVTVTDLGLTVKRERAGLWAWITSLRTAQPLVGVKLSAVSYSNQVLATALTDAEGIARLPVAEHPDGPPWVLIAESRDDLAYLRLDQNAWVLDDVDQTGRNIPATYDVLLYPERGAYRPGDPIHLTGIIRDAQGQVPESFPLTIAVIRPDGRRVADLGVTPKRAEQGMFHVDCPTSPDSQTGPYRFEVSLPGSKDILGSTLILVEAFLPVRIEVQAEPTQSLFAPGQTPRLAISARYLFGQPASQLPVTVTGSLQRVPFEPTTAEDRTYTFGSDKQPREELPEIEAVLDETGCVPLEVPCPTIEKGLHRANLSVTVTEPGGRSVSKVVTCLVDTADRHLGLRVPAQVVRVQETIDLAWIVRNGAGAPAASAPVDLSLSRVVYDSVLRRRNGTTYWSSTERLVPIVRETAEGNAGALTVSCPEHGMYRFKAVDRTTGIETSLDFFASAWREERLAGGFNRPERIELRLDRERFVPGSTAKLVVNSPFAGTLLLCLESDGVLNHRIIPLKENSATIDLAVPVNLRGGAFLTASVVRELDPSRTQWLPHRAQGMLRLIADHDASKLPVEIQVVPTARPGDTIPVTVSVGAASDSSRPAWVHLWAVDEGILLTTAYPTPDPHRHFFGPRRASVTTSDLFGDLLPDYQRPAGTSRIGGDVDGTVEALRRGPVHTPRAAPAVIWRTSVPATDGQLSVDVPLPNHSGELRFMAVAVEGDRYGSADVPMTLTQPLLVEAAWPRFAAPGDAFQVPVKVFSAAPQPVTVDLSVEVTGAAELVSPQNFVFTVNPQEPVTHWLDVRATTTGTASARIIARTATIESGEVTAVSETAFPVRLASPLHTVTTFARFSAGEPFTWNRSQELSPATARTMLSLSAAPSVELRPAIDQLLDYPHGCVEQTSSRLFALLAAQDLLANDPAEASRQARVADLVQSGVYRLWSMQTRSGGLAYWPGQTKPDTWGTAYASGVLLEASRRGHTVDSRLTDELAKYLAATLNARGDVSLNDNEQAHVCRVLAGLQKPDLGWMTRLSERLDRLDMAGRADLAEAWVLAGRKDRAAAALPDDTLALSAIPTFHGRLTSATQQAARLLSVLLELDPQHPWIPGLVQRIENARKGGAWRTTVENAMVLSALATYQASNRNDADFHGTVEASVPEDHTPAAPQTFDHHTLATFRWTAPVESLRINSAGKGTIFVTASTTGLLSDASREAYDRGLYVRRYWTDRHGKAIDPANLNVGDLINVCVTLSTTKPEGTAPPITEGDLPELPAWEDMSQPGDVPNIAVVNPLPAGMEVENPRLATSAESPGSSSADHVELLDDRVLIYAPAGARPRVFRYALRVTTAGRFTLPPIQAACMYNPDVASVQPGSEIHVTK